MTLTFGSLFAGVGGFDLGLECSGMRCAWQVEIDPFCRQVLAKHWPDVPRYEDVRDVGRDNLPTVDLVCGGFPCQPFSVAGKQRGEQDDRNLWPEMRRVIAELRPRWVVAENVPGIRNVYLDTILSDLEGLDYTAGALDIPAVAFGAPHIRHRLFIMAHTDRRGCGPQGVGRIMGQIREPGANLGLALAERGADVAHANRPEQGRREQPQWGSCQRDPEPARDGAQERVNTEWWASEPAVGRVADGIPHRVDRLRALGNAVMPQVAEWIGRRIVAVDSAS